MKEKITIIAFIILPICIGKLEGQNITTCAGTGTGGFSGDGGPATSAMLFHPAGIAEDVSGNIYIGDNLNSRIRKINTSGTITTVGGNGTAGFSGDGGPATSAQFKNPNGVAVDLSGNLYFADYNNNRIRKISTSGTITTVAGNGTPGFSGDGAAATLAQLNSPSGVAVDASGNIYIADQLNSRIRKVNTSGIISTVAGSAFQGFSGDGGLATLAELSLPNAVTIDPMGNLYIADSQNNRIRKVITSGIISTIAGNGTQGFSGDGGPATSAALYRPMDVRVDLTGNVYFTDYWNQRVRSINTSGIINTIAGNGTSGFSGDGGPATSAQLYCPFAMLVSASGNIYLTDQLNERVRKFVNTTSVSLLHNENIIFIFPNPNCGTFLIKTNLNEATFILRNSLGQELFKKEIIKGENYLELNVAKGIYYYFIEEKKVKVQNGKMIIE